MPTNRLAEEEEPGAENAGGERDVRPLGPQGEIDGIDGGHGKGQAYRPLR